MSVLSFACVFLWGHLRAKCRELCIVHAGQFCMLTAACIISGSNRLRRRVVPLGILVGEVVCSKNAFMFLFIYHISQCITSSRFQYCLVHGKSALIFWIYMRQTRVVLEKFETKFFSLNYQHLTFKYKIHFVEVDLYYLK